LTSEQKGRDDFLNYFISSFPVKLLGSVAKFKNQIQGL